MNKAIKYAQEYNLEMNRNILHLLWYFREEILPRVKDIAEIRSILEKSLATITSILNDVKNCDITFPFATHKLPLYLSKILEGEYIENILHEIQNGTIYNKINTDSIPNLRHTTNIISGTTHLNILQVFLLQVTSHFNGEKIHQITDLLSANTYRIEIDPNLQGTIIPHFISEKYKDYEWIDGIHSEIIIPITGYSFGGSREDSRYWNKKFRALDCSEFIAYIMGMKCYAPDTIHYEQYIEGILQDREIYSEIERCFAYSTYPCEGGIFVTRSKSGSGGHIGFIYEVLNNNKFIILECARLLPDDLSCEGIGSSKYSIDFDKDYVYFFDINQDLNLVDN
jgi:hypothetical protein